MAKTYFGAVVTIFAVSTACWALESAPRRQEVAIITGEFREPWSREIRFGFESPSALGRKLKRSVLLDTENRFAIELPVVRGTLVTCLYNRRRSKWQWLGMVGSFLFGPPSPLLMYVEPGDSLHVAVDQGYLRTSYRFSGQSAGNSRFMAKWIRRFRTFQSGLDYKVLSVEDFISKVKRWRADQFSFLEKWREEHNLSPGFIEYATRYFNYGWARLMISYPTNFARSNGFENAEITSEYYEFLNEIPLVDESAIGVGNYNTFLMRKLDWESRRISGPPAFSKMFDLSGVDLSDGIRARLDSLYEEHGRHPDLSRMIDMSALGLPQAMRLLLDSLYKKRRVPKLSERYELAAMGLSHTAQSRLDSFYENSGRGISFITSKTVDTPSIDTTGGAVVIHIPVREYTDNYEQKIRALRRTPELSELVDLSGLGLSRSARAEIDSLYKHRQTLKLSEKLNLSQIGLERAVRVQLDSIYARKSGILQFSRRYDLAKEKLEGRVLYWFLAGQLIMGYEHHGGDGFALANRKWKDFQAINPYPEYNAAVAAALSKALALQPGRPAPDFTLSNPEGEPVSLSQFRGKVVLLDFWASWCGPCIKDLPYLRRIKKEVTGKSVVFLNLSLDASDAAWRKAIEKYNIEGVHVRIGNSGTGAAGAYNVRGIPAYFLVAPDGRIVERFSSIRLMTETHSIVEEIIYSLGSG